MNDQRPDDPTGSRANEVRPQSEKGGPKTWITLLAVAVALLVLLLVLANWIG